MPKPAFAMPLKFNSTCHPFQDAVSAEERIVDLKSKGKEAFVKQDYFTAMYYYGMVSV
jgi:hypothetical protein